MKTKLMMLLLLAGSSVFADSRFYVGFGYGGGYPYYAPRPVAVYAPPPAPIYEYYGAAPAPGYVWVSGYWNPRGPRYVWHRGYWARPPYARAVWVRPHYRGGMYYHGYWRR